MDEVVDDDWSRLPKVLPFMDVTEKEGEKGAPIWDPRMVSGVELSQPAAKRVHNMFQIHRKKDLV